MGVRFPGAGNTTIQNAVLPNATETVVAISAPLNISQDFAQIFLVWMCVTTNAGNGTGIQYRLRRGTTTAGTLINVGQVLTMVAGEAKQVSGCYVDTPGAIAAQQYALTCTTSGAGANDACVDVCIIAFSL